ncbi:MAG TPA: prephenate dehydratase [Solirubrobacteraceae bacterium]|jgi:prephenate dehydratase|nr:prephenate dehydratase [Solirubrobacteraceae bacterium]
MRIGFLGPEGTFSHQALLAAGIPDGATTTALSTIYGTVMAVHDGSVERALVPIENSLEGSVDVTLDALATDASDVRIVGETVLAIRNCLIVGRDRPLETIETVYSHPQANAQCARFLRTRLAGARVVSANSTADAVRSVTADPLRAHAALGNRLAAEIYGGQILLDGVDDDDGNQTRFVWLALADTPIPPGTGPAKTSIVFWGAGDESPGWLVRCLGEISDRQINMTRIESRPHRAGLGHYMFFADLLGPLDSPTVAEAIEGLRGHCEDVRVLGSYACAAALGGLPVV